MTDIVERLRHHADDKTQWGWRVNGPVLKEAADEIERLRTLMQIAYGNLDRENPNSTQIQNAVNALNHALYPEKTK